MGLNFGQAIEALKQGKKISREVWGGYWVLDIISNPMKDKNFSQEPMIYAYTKYNKIHPAIAYQPDILAEDWFIITVDKDNSNPV